MTPPNDASMAPLTTDTRLALLEDGVERLTSMIEALTSEVRRGNEALSEVAVLRGDVARLASDVTNCGITTRQVREELNSRIDRTKTYIGDVERKQDEDNRKLWFWQGAAWGAGAVVVLTISLLTYMAKGALDDIDDLKTTVHRIELDHQPRRILTEPNR